LRARRLRRSGGRRPRDAHDNNENGGKRAADLQDTMSDGFLSFHQIHRDEAAAHAPESCAALAEGAVGVAAAIDIVRVRHQGRCRKEGQAPEAVLRRL
jgi:hypothetical protein